MTSLHELLEHGQSYWLDNLSRDMIRSGELARRVEDEGLRGVTSNPAIFHKAITTGEAYDDEIADLVAGGAPVARIYESLVVADIRDACDVLRPVYDSSDGVDGYVSLEVSPRLIHDTAGSIEEGRRLWAAVDRPNLMIKIPGTPAGVPAIEQLLVDGINVNVTLLFDVPAYDEVARAHIRALRRRHDAGQPLSTVASVASFFLSRIDVLVDSLIAHRIDANPAPDGPARLMGKAAVASAKFAYRSFEQLYAGDEWQELASAGARAQRLLWASTSTKNPLYDPVRYVEPLIGPETVNTMPESTIEAFSDTGHVRPGTIRENYDDAVRVFQDLEAIGIDMVSVASQLVNEGAEKFIGPFDRLLGTLAARRRELLDSGASLALSDVAAAAGDALFGALEELRLSRRVVAGDASLWSDDEVEQAAIARRLGWIDAAARTREQLPEFEALAGELVDEGAQDVVVLGMGGSSLTPAVLSASMRGREGYPRLRVLDDIDPEAVRRLESDLDPDRTLFLVASKSGTTIETLSLYRHFRAWVEAAGVSPAGRRFVAVTDPGTPLVEEARTEGFRGVVETPADVGGRYSALTAFGILPAVLAGLDADGLLRAAERMRENAGPATPLEENPALGLGVRLGALARGGRDVLTITAPPALAAFPDWLEQLVAESTGKDGVGILPVIGEPARAASEYGRDRVFLHFGLQGAPSPDAETRLTAIEAEGHPVIRVALSDPSDLGGEFLRWELAVAAASVVLGVNPFDEPDVSEAKERARARLEAGPAGDDDDEPVDVRFVRGLEVAAPGTSGDPSLGSWIRQIDPDDYVAILAYFADSEERLRRLEQVRRAVAGRTGAPTTLGFGPRYLHSTGQLHKGGPARGSYLVLTADVAEDLAVPGRDYGLADIRLAQALGDAEALADRGRPVLQVNLGWYVEDGLESLAGVLQNGDPAG